MGGRRFSLSRLGRCIEMKSLSAFQTPGNPNFTERLLFQVVLRVPAYGLSFIEVLPGAP